MLLLPPNNNNRTKYIERGKDATTCPFCMKALQTLNFIIVYSKNKDENAHRYSVRGIKDRERDEEREKEREKERLRRKYKKVETKILQEIITRISSHKSEQLIEILRI